MAAGSDDGDEPVSVDIDIGDGETTITVTGEQDAAVVVRSADGERVYLPPERTTDDEPDPYRSSAGGDSPYEGRSGSGPYAGQEATPYGSARDQGPEFGLTRTAAGFRIRHPEPATDVRLLR